MAEQRQQHYVSGWLKPIAISLATALVVGMLAWWKSQDIDSVTTANSITLLEIRADGLAKEIDRLEAQIQTHQRQLRDIELQIARMRP
jgi:hypothetical protein